MTQFDMRKLTLLCGLGAGRRWAFDGDLDQLGAGADANILAARGDDLGAVAWFAEAVQESREICLCDVLLVASEDTRHLAARDSRRANDVGLANVGSLGDARESNAEVAHLFLFQFNVPHFRDSYNDAVGAMIAISARVHRSQVAFTKNHEGIASTLFLTIFCARVCGATAPACAALRQFSCRDFPALTEFTHRLLTTVVRKEKKRNERERSGKIL
jgi:hypothetical protein